ncbi:hypothetical protein [Ilumatobacter sp.]|uniref:hypothetical protein n=1 Tax=Ilumatobacter sp. TaxID=1967498 RepID=UPI003B521C68
MGTAGHLLTTRQMAEFVANGFLRFDEIVPADLNERAVAELAALDAGRLLPSESANSRSVAGLVPSWCSTTGCGTRANRTPGATGGCTRSA